MCAWPPAGPEGAQSTLGSSLSPLPWVEGTQDVLGAGGSAGLHTRKGCGLTWRFLVLWVPHLIPIIDSWFHICLGSNGWD